MSGSFFDPTSIRNIVTLHRRLGIRETPETRRVNQGVNGCISLADTAAGTTRRVAVLPKPLLTPPHCGATEQDLATSTDHGPGMKSIAKISRDLNPFEHFPGVSHDGRTPLTAGSFAAPNLALSYTCVSTQAWSHHILPCRVLRPCSQKTSHFLVFEIQKRLPIDS